MIKKPNPIIGIRLKSHRSIMLGKGLLGYNNTALKSENGLLK